VAALVVVGLVVAAALLATGDSAGGLSGIRPNHVGVIDQETNTIVAEIQVGIRPGPVVVGGGSVWVGNLDDQTLTRIGAATRSTTATIPLDDRTPTGVAFGEGAVWVAHGQRGELSRVDPQFEQLTDTLDVATPSSQLGAVAVGAGSVWGVYGDSTMVRVDPRDVSTTGSSFVDETPWAAVVAGGLVWVANAPQASVTRFNPSTFEQGPIGRPISVGRAPVAIAFGEGAIWVANRDDDRVTRIDPATTATTPIPVGDGPTAIAVGADSVWVANTAAGTISRIDPVTYEVQTIEVGNAPAGIAVGAGMVWVTVQAP
jgi:YVTN family beta-propeller protein